MPHIHTLSLVTTERESEPKSVCDFMVDGKMLSSQIDSEEFISPFGWGCPDYQKVTIDWFMLENACDELNGRLPIFVCPMCGDFGCGVGTVEVIKEDQHIVWQNFRWERDYDEWTQQSDNQKHFKRIFGAEQYMKVFDLYRSTL